MRHVRLRGPVIGVILVCSVLVSVEAVADTLGGPSSAQDRLEAIIGRMEAATRDRDALQQQLVALIDQLEQTSGAIERIQGDIASTRTRIADVTRMIHLQQGKLDEEVRALYMSPPVEAIGSALGTTSLNDFQDAIEFLGAVSQGNRDLIASLSNMKAELERHRIDLETLRERLNAARRRLRLTSGDVVRKLADARALLHRLDRDEAAARALIRDLEKGVRTEARRRIDELDQPDPPFPPGPLEVKGMIRRSFAPLGPQTQQVALCVADVESDFDPLAVNPSTGAAGVYQFKPSTWSSMSVQAGWGGHSVFDAQANVAVAAWTVGRYGWGAWGSVATGCGA